MAQAVSSTEVQHPLAALTAAEIATAVALVKSHPTFTEETRFAYIGLAEPSKAQVRAWSPGEPVVRRVRLMLVAGPEADVVEVVASLHNRRPLGHSRGRGPTRPSLRGVVRGHRGGPGNAQWQEAMRKRGIEDLDTVQIDPWPAGSFGVSHEEGRRICRCLFYVRHTPEDNGYAHPIEGVVAFVDMARGEVLEIIDTGVIPVPTECGNYYPESVSLREDLRPVEITQPEGPSFSVDGNLVHWQKWSLRVSMDSVEGLILHDVGYEDHGRVRPILFRASVTEMVVPYGDPGPMHGWKNAFDAGEWGLGRMANSLTLGCDCLGVIHYFDAVFSSERGHPYVVQNAICMHEEDYGILWKHNDPRSGTKRGPQVASTRGELDRHGGQLRLRLLLVLLPRRDDPIRGEAHRHLVDHGSGTGRGSPLRIDGGSTTGRALPSAPVQRPTRRRCRRDHQFGLRGEHPPGAARPRQSVGQRLRARDDPARDRVRGTARGEPGHQPVLEDRERQCAEPPGDCRLLQARPRIHPHPPRQPGLERGQARRLRHTQPLGHSLRSRRAARRG